MTISTVDFVKAREAASAILEELQLDAYLFEVEPKDDVWEIIVECASEVDGGWATVTLQISNKMMLDGLDNDVAKGRFYQYWKKQLAMCKIRQT